MYRAGVSLSRRLSRLASAGPTSGLRPQGAAAPAGAGPERPREAAPENDGFPRLFTRPSSAAHSSEGDGEGEVGPERAPALGEVAPSSLLDDLRRRMDAILTRTRAAPASALPRVDFADLTAVIEAKGEDGLITLRFDRSGPALDDAIREIGVMPLPPYIAAKRAEDDRDRSDYQTVYAAHDGSVAAPTAGLHFTPGLLDALRTRGISTHAVTLHVGAGTFLPVKADDTADHKMHSEWGTVSEETAASLNAVRASGGRIVCVGTTSLRLLESAATPDGVIHPFHDDTAIFITPGYRFRAVDVLMTNFHLPKSTLFMLVSAFTGLETMKTAYAHAIQTGYRFYSYGDGSLLFRG